MVFSSRNKLSYVKLVLLGACAFAHLVQAAPRPQQVKQASALERAIDFAKKVYTLEYLDGENGEYRNASLAQKMHNQPGRACVTAVFYGSSFIVAKLLYDLADKLGVWQGVKEQAQKVRHERQVSDYQVRQRERYEDALRNQRADDNQAPRNPLVFDRVNNPARVLLANPMRGRQLQVDGIPHLNGFYHMHSHTPYHDLFDGCGVNVAYNMALIENRLYNRAVDQVVFDRIVHQEFPELGTRGATDDEVARIAQRMNLAPLIALNFNQAGQIQRLGRMIRHNGHDQENAFQAAADQDLNEAARQFRQGRGIQVAHFLCGIPGHWIGISVTRNAQNQQAMYLFDNLNDQAVAVDHMRRHVENIYNRFF